MEIRPKTFADFNPGVNFLCATSVFPWLTLCGEINHRDTENTEVAQRKIDFLGLESAGVFGLISTAEILPIRETQNDRQQIIGLNGLCEVCLKTSQ